MPRRTTRIYRPTSHNLTRLARALQRGELVATPSETVYGLAADAFNAKACRAIYTAKRRPATDPLIVHFADRRTLSELGETNELVERLARGFWPGPLTLIIRKSPRVPAIVTAGLDSVAVRMPAHPLFRQLIRAAGRPLAAPSANPFSYISPTTAEHVRDGLNGRISYILDGGACAVGVESTIVDARDPKHPVILRPGGIPAADISAALGRDIPQRDKKLGSTTAATAPGQLIRHYSPRTPVTLHAELTQRIVDAIPADEAIVAFGPTSARLATAQKNRRSFVLSPDGTGASAARGLFHLLRRLDQRKFPRIHVERAPAGDPWSAAINDRLERAAARTT